FVHIQVLSTEHVLTTSSSIRRFTAPSQREPAFRCRSHHCPSGRRSRACNLRSRPSRERKKYSPPGPEALPCWILLEKPCRPGASSQAAAHPWEASYTVLTAVLDSETLGCSGSPRRFRTLQAAGRSH